MGVADGLLILLIAFALIGAVRFIKKRGLSSCSGGCEGCPRAGECGKKKRQE